MEIGNRIETNDEVYTFSEVLENIDLSRYLRVGERRTGRPRYDEEILLKITLFAFMENGYVSLRKLEKLCKTDIRYMWLLQNNPAPSHMTIDNFMNNVLSDSIENIFTYINAYIFEQYASDMDCFIPLIERFAKIYRNIPNILLPMQAAETSIITFSVNNTE